MTKFSTYRAAEIQSKQQIYKRSHYPNKSTRDIDERWDLEPQNNKPVAFLDCGIFYSKSFFPRKVLTHPKRKNISRTYQTSHAQLEGECWDRRPEIGN